jgi:superfamily II DNA/RNA helicase
MQSFRDGKLKILVSTNLTSRGIDVPDIAHVINYDCPEQVEEYVHRIGRTARMGREGTAVTFVGEWDIEFFDAIRDHVGAEKLEAIHLSMYGDPNRGGPVDEDDPEPEEVDEPTTEVEADEPADEAATEEPVAEADADDEPDDVEDEADADDEPADDSEDADEAEADDEPADVEDEADAEPGNEAESDDDDPTDDDEPADDADDEPEAPAGDLGRPAR